MDFYEVTLTEEGYEIHAKTDAEYDAESVGLDEYMEDFSWSESIDRHMVLVGKLKQSLVDEDGVRSVIKSIKSLEYVKSVEKQI